MRYPDLFGEPVDAIPETAGEEGQDHKMNAVRSDKEREEEELEGGEGGVGRDKEGRRGAWGEDRLPQVFEEAGCHAGRVYVRSRAE